MFQQWSLVYSTGKIVNGHHSLAMTPSGQIFSPGTRVNLWKENSGIQLCRQLYNLVIIKMISKLFVFFCLLSTAQEIFGCEYYDPDETRHYSTTVCTNISSFQNIPFIPRDNNVDQFLEITQSNINTVPKSSFWKFPTITKLYLTKNHIKQIVPGAFNDLIVLKELHLNLNQLTEVSTGVYNSLKQLEILNLANNEIETVEKFALNGLSHLREVNFENNRIRYIEAHSFDSQTQLQLLDISGNPLEKFDGDGLSTLSALILAETYLTSFDDDLTHLKMEILNLSSSRLKTVDFSRYPKIEKIYLSNNELVSISNLDKLDSSYITLDNNRIKTISGTFNDVSFVTLKHNELEILTNTLFNESATIRFIDLSHNKISLCEKDTFRWLTELQMLHLQYNKISKLDPKLFVDLEQLKYLDLSHNNIQDLQYGTFDNLIQLKVLNISDNKLRSLHENGLLSVISLEELVFHNNQISALDVETLMKFKSQMKSISFNNNRWDCKEVAQTYIKFITNHSSLSLAGLTEEGENFHGITCTSKGKDTWDESEMSKFFNEDFKNSNFVQFFQSDYKNSEFFKFLNKLTVDGQKSATRAEKFVSDETPHATDNRVLIFSVMLQMAIVLLLLLNFWNKRRHV